jgi:hypothetical protein
LGADHCNAPGCGSTDWCDAHIVTRGFARTLSAPGRHNRAIRADGSRKAKQPLGPFDPRVLCSACDAKLGAIDEYAIDFCRAIGTTSDARTGSPFRRAHFDGDRFCLAVLAILWRASLSSHPQWSGISLGPYEARAGEILFGHASLSALAGFEVVLMRYASSEHDARKFIFEPLRIRSGQLNVFVLGIGGFQVIAKFDQRPFDRLLQPYVINGATALNAIHVRLEETAEYAYFQRAAAADRRRTSRPA